MCLKESFLLNEAMGINPKVLIFAVAYHVFDDSSRYGLIMEKSLIMKKSWYEARGKA